MKRIYTNWILTGIVMCFSYVGLAQFNNTPNGNFQNDPAVPNRGCGTGILPQQFEVWLQEKMASGPAKGGNNSTESVYTIPVIVHIVHNNESINTISATSGNNLNAAQIQDQIDILNKDYNGLNADTTQIQSVFKPYMGKFKINFCLAVVNPTGGVLAEPGIDRINRVSKGWSASPYSQTYIDATIKPGSIWDPARYLNIWVLDLGNSLLGYATFPNPGTTGIQGLGGPYGSATTDGVVIKNKAFGSIGTAASYVPYNKGRTTTHEIGHYVGLRHTWGDSNCGNDYCNDTPTSQQANFGCPTFPHVTCSNGPNGDMFVDYMDYTDDGCMHMFTKDQMYRAQVIMANSVYRSTLLTSTVCNLPSVTNDLAVANIASPTYSQVINCDNFINPVVKIHNMGSNAITAATFTYNVDGVNTQTLNWTGNLASNTSTNLNIAQISNLSNGVHNFNFKVITINSVADTYTINNYSTQLFSTSNGYDFNASATTPICSGDNATLTASGSATSYTWNPGNITGSSATVSPASTAIYTLTGAMGSCAKTKTVLITVNPTPTLVANSTTICTGGTATLVASGATTYSWSTTQTTSVITVSPASNTTYTIYGFNGSCASSKEVTVSIGSSLGIMANASPSSYCSGSSATIMASGASSYTWMPGNLSGSVVVVNPTSSTTYTISGSAASCTGTGSVMLTVNPTPTLTALALNPTVCIPGSGTTLNSSGASTYTWQPGSLVGANVSVNPNLTTTYTVTGESSAGCMATKTVVVTAVNKPFINAASSSNTTCAGAPVQLFATGGTTYVWEPGTIVGANVVVSPTSTTIYTVTGTTSGCSNTKLVTISVSPCTGLSNISASQFKVNVYPNPFKDDLKVDINDAAYISIYNAIGQEVLREKAAASTTISTSELPVGVYVIKVQNASESKVFRLIKQ